MKPPQPPLHKRDARDVRVNSADVVVVVETVEDAVRLEDVVLHAVHSVVVVMVAERLLDHVLISLMRVPSLSLVKRSKYSCDRQMLLSVDDDI